MPITPSTDRYTFDIGHIHPIMKPSIRSMIETTLTAGFFIDGTRYIFRPFEGYRGPVRQEYLCAVMKTSKARPWQSAHQYGLAVDFACVPIVNGKITERWTWSEDAPWQLLKEIAISCDLDIPIKGDRGHVQHPAFAQIRKFLI